MGSLEEYAEARRKRQLIIVRLFSFLGIVSFTGATLFTTVSLFRNGLKSIQNPPPDAVQSEANQLKTDKKGYELVLAREPDNRTALEGLVQVQIKLNDLSGAKASLDRLIKLDPNNADYQRILGEVTRQLQPQ